MSKKLLKLFGGSDDPVWIVRDLFTGTLAAGSVHGTATTDGKGLRYVVDAESKLSIAGKCVVSGGGASPSYGNPYICLTPPGGEYFDFDAGKMVFAKWLREASNTGSFGSDSVLGGLVSGDLRVGSGYLYRSSAVTIGTIENGSINTMAVVRCGTNTAYLKRQPGASAWQLMWLTSESTSDVGNPAFSNYNMAFEIYELGLADLLASGDDRFATNTGLATSVDTSVAVNDTGAHETDGWLELNNVTLPTGGSVLTFSVRRQDADNYWAFLLTAAGRMYFIERVAGAETTRIYGGDGTVTNGCILRVRMVGTTMAVFKDNTQVSATYTSAANFADKTTWKVEGLGTGGALGVIYAWPYNVTLRGRAGRL